MGAFSVDKGLTLVNSVLTTATLVLAIAGSAIAVKVAYDRAKQGAQ